MSRKPSTESLPPEVRRYLTIATIFLLPVTRKAVQDELYANFYQTMQRSKWSGLSDAAAWAETLAQAGSPWKAALGFARVYSLGLVLRGALVGAALGGAAYAAHLTGGHP